MCPKFHIIWNFDISTDGRPKVKSYDRVSLGPELSDSVEHLSFDWLRGLSSSEYLDNYVGAAGSINMSNTVRQESVILQFTNSEISAKLGH